jgi:LytS/YehU family sensor histidine kinase
MKIFSNRYSRLLLHVGFWLVLFCLLSFDVLESTLRREMIQKLLISTQIVASFAVVTYLNFYFLMLRLLYKKPFGYYVLSLFALILTACFINDVTLHWFYHTQNQLFDRTLTLTLFQCFVSGIKIFRNDVEKNKRINELERIRTQKELELLKSKVNPHFLFNTLNNLYALTLTDGQTASEVVLKLSELMRYMFTTAQQPSVSLQKEVDYLTNYLSLEKLRLNTDAVIKWHKNGDFQTKSIAPMLLLPFVENAFKHGVETQNQNISVELDVALQENDLFFQIKNSKPTHTQVEKTGTGLANIQKRLELLYPEKHVLNINEDKNTFTVKLWIQLWK